MTSTITIKIWKSHEKELCKKFNCRQATTWKRPSVQLKAFVQRTQVLTICYFLSERCLFAWPKITDKMIIDFLSLFFHNFVEISILDILCRELYQQNVGNLSAKNGMDSKKSMIFQYFSFELVWNREWREIPWFLYELWNCSQFNSIHKKSYSSRKIYIFGCNGMYV